MPSTTTKQSEFYFDDSLVVIRVEDTLFKIHKYQLLKSEVFSDMFATANEDPQEGSSPEKPIVLEGVAASDFECLTKGLYVSQFSTHPLAPETSLIMPAFRLANKWNFADLLAHLRTLAEHELDDIDRITFARECDIREWLAPAHAKLCLREEPFTTNEAVKLGVHSGYVTPASAHVLQSPMPPVAIQRHPGFRFDDSLIVI